MLTKEQLIPGRRFIYSAGDYVYQVLLKEVNRYSTVSDWKRVRDGVCIEDHKNLNHEINEWLKWPIVHIRCDKKLEDFL